MKAFAGPAVLLFVAAVMTFGMSGVAIAETGCTANIPDVIISPSKLVSPPGETAVFTVDVENEDSDNCPIKKFAMSGSSVGGFSVSFSPSTVFIAPGDSETTLMKVVVPSSAVAKEYEVKAVANNGNFSGTDTATLEVRQQVEECEVAVSNLRFKEKNSDQFDDEFAKDDEVSVLVDVSLLGNAASDVTLELFVDGSVFDSETDSYPGNSDTTFKFGNRIFTKNYNDKVNVRVVATAACNPTKTDDDDDTIDIVEAEEDIDIEVRVGKPANTVIGKEVVSRVFVENNGEEDVDVNLDAKLCRIGFGCKIEMNCGDSTILVEDDDTEEIVCRATPTEPGKYRVDVEVTFEGDDDRERSNDFFVYSTAAELAQFPGVAGVVVSTPVEEAEKVKEVKYTCSGNLRQAVFSTTSGVKVSDIEFCPNGCLEGRCTQQAGFVKKKTAPTTTSSEGEQPKPVFSSPKFNPPVFDFTNFIDWIKNLLLSGPS